MVYDILRGFRKVFNYSAVTVFFQDVIFSVCMTLSVFLFLLSVTNGEMRGFVLIGLAFGFVISRFTLSVIWFKLLRWILSAFKNGIFWISKGFYKGFDFLSINIIDFFKKSGKHLKKVLKTQGNMLYTKGNRKNRSYAYEKKTQKE